MPLIGICAARETASWTVWNRQPAVLVGDAYVRSVQNAGADVVLIAPTPTPNVGILDQLDGLLLPGGLDVDPAAYGAELEPGCEDIDPDRDSFELALTRSALERNIPVLGICRGMQVINVALGGTLQQDVEAQLGKAHRPALGSLAEDSAHPVEFAEGSLCAEIANSARETVRSHHHQAVANAGKGVRIAATSALDGVCEAIEVEGCHFAIGVQWHAEATPGDRFIPAFVTASTTGAR